jgi:hypothetical protein
MPLTFSVDAKPARFASGTAALGVFVTDKLVKSARLASLTSRDIRMPSVFSFSLFGAACDKRAKPNRQLVNDSFDGWLLNKLKSADGQGNLALSENSGAKSSGLALISPGQQQPAG